MKKTVILSSLILVLVIAATVFAGVMRSHTFTFGAVVFFARVKCA